MYYEYHHASVVDHIPPWYENGGTPNDGQYDSGVQHNQGFPVPQPSTSVDNAAHVRSPISYRQHGQLVHATHDQDRWYGLQPVADQYWSYILGKYVKYDSFHCSDPINLDYLTAEHGNDHLFPISEGIETKPISNYGAHPQSNAMQCNIIRPVSERHQICEGIMCHEIDTIVASGLSMSERAGTNWMPIYEGLPPACEIKAITRVAMEIDLQSIAERWTNGEHFQPTRIHIYVDGGFRFISPA